MLSPCALPTNFPYPRTSHTRASSFEPSPGTTEQELESRRITEISQGIRQIESAWPESAARTTPAVAIDIQGRLFRVRELETFPKRKYTTSWPLDSRAILVP